MPTSTIGTASRDYSTMTSWEADLGTGSQIGECYDDSTFDESVTINDADPDDITLTVASGERHDGTAGTGARVVTTADNRRAIISVDCDVFWLEWDINGRRCDNGIVQLTDTGAVSTRKIGRMLLHSVGLGFSTDGILVQSFRGSSAGQYDILFNNSIYDLINGDTGAGSTGWAIRMFEGDIFNQTVHDITNDSANQAHGIGIQSATSSGQNVRNCASTSVADSCFDNTGVTNESHNASSDATASGTGSLTNITTASQYVSTVAGSEDLHIQDPDADIFEAGTDLGTTPSGVNFDIDGYDRDAGGTTWSIGAHDGNNLRGVVQMVRRRSFSRAFSRALRA